MQQITRSCYKCVEVLTRLLVGCLACDEPSARALQKANEAANLKHWYGFFGARTGAEGGEGKGRDPACMLHYARVGSMTFDVIKAYAERHGDVYARLLVAHYEALGGGEWMDRSPESI